MKELCSYHIFIGVSTLTEENYKYRTSPLLLRNQFKGSGQWKIPDIPKADFNETEFDDLKLIGFDRTNLENNNHLERMVHFFLYDYKFERVWKNPDNDIEKLLRYRAVLSPDFSMYVEMAPVIQLYNLFRNRWCGAYFASKGIRVIPTISWGNENTFDFSFEGVPKGSTVAVSTYMVSAHNHHADQKQFFLKGYHEMIKRLEPSRIICYNKPFPEMEGNIIYIDYELSSWKYQNDDYKPSKYIPYICGQKISPSSSNIVIKTGSVLQNYSSKGMGSAYDGGWRPSKQEDERLIGEPGEIKTSYDSHGNQIDTKIGEDGYAEMERHYTDHGNPKQHSNPHDHMINWDSPNPNMPNFEKPNINYPPDLYPGGAPEFKWYEGEKYMSNYVGKNSLEENRFKTISDFKDCIHRGGEIEFNWNEKTFGIWPNLQKDPLSTYQTLISQVYIDDMEQTETWCDTADEVLEYRIDGICLRDIITKVDVTYRSF